MHPTDAKDGGSRRVTESSSALAAAGFIFWADVTEKVAEGSVEMNVAAGKPIHVEGWRDANANFLTDFYNRDPISGFPVFKALLCEIEKA